MFRPLSSVIHYIYDIIQITIDTPPVNYLESSSRSRSNYADQPGRDYIILDVMPAESTDWRKRVCITKRS
jgi:hypothetical protein